MAVLGVQLAFSMIVASVLSKLSGHYSFGRWILCRSGRLARFIHPSDEELRRVAGNAPRTGNKNKRGNERKAANSHEDFTVLKSAIEIQLDRAPINPPDLLPLQFFTEFKWLMDFSVCALFMYSVTELYYAVMRPTTETNLSLFWCLLVGGFAIKIMYSMTAIYFRVEEGGEKMLCILFAAFFLVAAMAVLVVDDQTLDFGLQAAYENFTAAAVAFLEEEGKEEGTRGAGPISLLTVRIILAGMCAAIGAFVTFPGLRLAKMHTDALRYTSEHPVRQLLLYINIAFPLFISLTWVRPIFRDRLVTNQTRVDDDSSSSDPTVSSRFPVLDDEAVQLIRIVLIFIFCLFRFVLVWDHLQAHLNMAVDRVSELKKEAGRISSTELKKHIVRVYYYLCVVALQYLAPLVLLLFCALLLKTLGDFSILRSLGFDFTTSKNTTVRSNTPRPTAIRSESNLDPDSPEGIAENIIGTASQFSQSLVRLKLVFSPLCFRGLLSFTSWWICTAWFTTSVFGLLYYSYFTS